VNYIYYLVAALAGMANPAQAGANAKLLKNTENALFSAIVVYASGLVFMLIAQFIARQTWPTGVKLTTVLWWAWAASTIAGITLAQQLGPGFSPVSR
jgi:transporter family-2 protein